MNKTSIDFFSRGVVGKKPRLSIKVFGLDTNCEIKQSPIKRKPSLSHTNFSKSDKKQTQLEKGLDYKQKQILNAKIKKPLSSTQSSFPSTQSLTPLKKKVIKFQGSRIDDQFLSLQSIIGDFEMGKHKIYEKFQSLPSHLDLSQMPKFPKPIIKITEQCQMHQQSYNTQMEVESTQILNSNMNNNILSHDQQNQKRKIFKKTHSNKIEQPKKNFYFIRNLVLQNNINPNDNQNIQRCNSEQKYIIRRLPAVSLAASNIYRNSHHLNIQVQQQTLGQIPPNKQIAKNRSQFEMQRGTLVQAKTCVNIKRKQKIKQIVLPSSLIANRIGYNSEVKPVRKKLQRNFLPLANPHYKNREQNEYGIIDRWEYAKEDNNCWDLQRIS